jgi:ATP-dependent Clp protease ATP-binding subunit ClpA
MAKDDNYEGAFERDSRDLVQAALNREVLPAAYRELLVQSILSHLERGRSVLVVGPDGAGKSSVVHGLAHALSQSTQGRVRGLRQLSTSDFFSRTRYLGEWESKTAKMLETAEASGAALYLPDLWNAFTAGRTVQSTRSLWDMLHARIEANRLLLVGEATPEQLRRVEHEPGVLRSFVVVRVEPLTPEQCDAILTQRGTQLGLSLTPPILQAIRDLASRFLPAQLPPGPDLALLAQVHDYIEQKRAAAEEVVLDQAFVEKVFSIYSGLPLFVVSPRETRAVEEIRSYFAERLIGQREAIEAVVQTIALYKAGLHDPSRPVGSFLFVGPTGVGKTELARLLAAWLFGSPQRLLRFDCGELKDYHAFERLVGNPREPTAAAQLLDPVRAQPFQVVLFDELEKAHPNLCDLLLPLLDEGHLTSAHGRRVDFRNTLIIATSNVGARSSEKVVGFGALADVETRAARLRTALEAELRPEFINRFQHIVPFHALTTEQVRQIARLELRSVLGREGIARRRIAVEVEDAALDLVAQHGYDPRFGARALKREVQKQLVMPLAVLLVERDLLPGSVVRLSVREEKLSLRIEETEATTAARKAMREVAGVEQRRATREDLVRRLRTLGDRIEGLARQLDESVVRAERDRLAALRHDHTLWKDTDAAHRELRELERNNRTLALLLHLRERRDELLEALPRADTRERLRFHEQRIETLDAELAVVRRELWALGRDGEWDTLLEVRPFAGEAEFARRFLVDLYVRWARARDLHVEWVCDPRTEDEPVVLSLSGRYPHGYLRAESGVHRVRDGERFGAARVRVVPLTDTEAHTAESARFRFLDRRALKGTGLYGNTVRSRLGGPLGLLIQNGHTLAENEALAREFLPSWLEGPEPSDDVVRRWDLTPLRVRDALLDETIGRAEVAQADGFHDVLCRRADLLAEGGGPRGPEVA